MENLIPSADGVQVLTPSVPFLGPAWLGGQPAWEVAEVSSDREPGRRQGCQLTRLGVFPLAAPGRGFHTFPGEEGLGILTQLYSVACCELVVVRSFFR